jgi:hypothetical protein
MSENLSRDVNPQPSASVADAFTIAEKPANRMILMGAPEWVRGVIHRLHGLGVAEVGSWSRLIPTRNSGEVISILKRRRREKVLNLSDGHLD